MALLHFEGGVNVVFCTSLRSRMKILFVTVFYCFHQFIVQYAVLTLLEHLGGINALIGKFLELGHHVRTVLWICYAEPL